MCYDSFTVHEKFTVHHSMGIKKTLLCTQSRRFMKTLLCTRLWALRKLYCAPQHAYYEESTVHCRYVLVNIFYLLHHTRITKLLLNLSPFDHEGKLPNPITGIECMRSLRTDTSCKTKACSQKLIGYLVTPGFLHSNNNLHHMEIANCACNSLRTYKLDI
jgi:hypothetical protein